MGLHSTRSNTTAMHGIVKKTVANAAALAAETPSAAELADRAVWLQTDTRQLWIPKSTTAGDFESISVLGPTPGGFAPSCNSLTHVFEDWIVQTTLPAASSIVQGSGLFCDASGSGAVGAFQTSTVTERGLLRYSTGTTTTGFYGFVCGGASNKSIKLQTSDGFYFGVRTSIANLSDATDTFLAFHGPTSGTEALGNDALVVIHDRSIDATHWVFRMVAGGTPTNIISTVTITVGQLYILEMVKLPGSNTVTCYIDGTSVGTFTLASPTAVMQMSSYIVKSAGTTARTTDVDWIDMQILQPTKRAASFLA